MKILVTGFEPFGGENINPALEVLKSLPKTLAGAEIVTLVVPTVFGQSAQVLQEKMEAEQPDAVLCIGQAGGRMDLSLERVAINLDDARIPDNLGQQPIDEPIQSEGEPAYFSTLPIKAMVEAVRSQGIPSSVSNTAGTFVCNHLMYQALHLANTRFPSTKVGFLHIPFLPEQVIAKPHRASMSLEVMLRGIKIALEALVLHGDKADVKTIGGATH